MTTKIQEQNSFPDPGPRLGTSITVIEHDSTNYDAYIMGGIDLSDVCTTVVSRYVCIIYIC